MNERVAAVEPNGQKAANFRPTEPGAGRASAESDVRFTYPSGSRPLEGYTIQRAVGRGGFGEVYYATSDTGRQVALKAVQTYEQIELRGIQQCMNLKSPHLVSVFDAKYNADGTLAPAP